jgi:four helix bundle protein
MKHRPMRFEDLDTWQEARQMTRENYVLTRKNEIARDFGLCGQVQRAGVSTMSNVAEGFERKHMQEKLQFYNVAHASTAEIRSLTYVIEDNYANLSGSAIQLRETVLQCGRLLTGLIRSTESRKRSAFFLLLSAFSYF